MFDVHSSRATPRSAFRRTETSRGEFDELFSRDLTWKPSALLFEAEHGDTMFDFTEISEAEADQIVARIRANAPYDA
jgi:hypothetical protein